MRRVLLFLSFVIISCLGKLNAQVSLTTIGATSTENFDGMSNVASPSTIMPANWVFLETLANANTTYVVDAGATNAGNTYSYGTGAAVDRCLGGVRSANLATTFGASFVNNTGTTITALNIGYFGEEWRCGQIGRGADQLTFEYSLNATSLSTGIWTAVPALHFTSPDVTSTGAKNGNAVAERTLKTAVINALLINPGAVFWIRWTDVDATGSDDGLGVDDFGVQPLSSLPEINLVGNLTPIIDGDVTPSLTDHTDFGSVAACGGSSFTRTYTIANSGTVNLNISSVTITGANASDFVVTTPPAAVVAPSSFTTFVVTFTPSAAGLRTATITVNNDDADESVYDFAIQGTGTDAVAPAGSTTFTYSGPGVIPAGAPATFNLPVSGMPAILGPGSITSICMDITYPTVQDLEVFLFEPSSGSFIQLTDIGAGPTGTNFTATCFDLVSATSLASGAAPYSGVFNDAWLDPAGFNAVNGANPNGNWQILIDNAGGSAGTINSFSMTINGQVMPDITAQCSATISTAPTLPDNCAGTVTGTATIGGVPQIIPFTVNTQGTTVVVWTFNDGNGNSTIINQNVIINDTQAPDAGMVTSTFTLTGPLAINPSTNFYQIPLSGLPNPLTAGMLSSVCFDVTFPTVEDLDVFLLDSSASSGTIFSVATLLSGPNFTNTCFDRLSAGNTIDLGASPYTGNFDASLFTPFDLDGNVGFPTNGHWLFDVENYGTNTGTLNSVTLTFVYPLTQYPDITNTCSQTINSAPTLPDNCAVTVAGTAVIGGVPQVIPFTINTQGTTLIVWTFDDGNGNITTVNQNVILTDTIDPSISCTSDVTTNAAAGLCTATVTLTAPTVSDNCGVNAPTNNHPSTTYAVGTTPVTWTVTDINGNSSTCIQNVTVNDTQNPTISCVDVSFNVDPGLCSATVTLTAPAATDNCGVNAPTNDHPSTTFPVGTTIVNWTVVDFHSNINTCAQNVVIVDSENPVATCPSNITVGATAGLCNAVVNFTPTATDNCAGVSIVSSPASGSTFAVGTTTVNVTATDASANSNACSFTVTVNDTEAPVVTCPSNITVSATAGSCNAVVNFTPTATDNCAGVSIVSSPASGSTFALGTTTVNVTATDAASNTNACSFTVTVNDTQAPVVTCDSVVAAPTFGVPDVVTAAEVILSSTDNCGIASSSVAPNSFSCAQNGQNIPVVVTVTDVNGNPTICNTFVIVTGTGCSANNPPVAVCQPVTVNADGSCQGNAAASAFDGGSTDPDLDPLTFSVIPAGPYALGTTNVTLTVSDGTLTSTCNTTITVVDNTAPDAGMVTSTFTLTGPLAINPSTNFYQIPLSGLPNPLTAGMLSSVCFDVTFPTVEDLDVFLLDSSASSGTIFSLATLLSGPNFTNTCFDRLSAGNTIDLSTSPYTGNFDASLFTPFDLDGNVGFPTNGHWLFDVENYGTNTGTLNSVTLTFVYPLTQYPDITNICSQTINSAPTLTDNCAGTVTGTAVIGGVPQTIPFTINTQGTTLIAWTFNDGNGNITTVNQNVILTDTIDPSISCASDVTTNAAVGLCNATVTLTDPTVSDNCGVNLPTNDHPSATYAVGTTPVTWTVTDINGNSSTCIQNVTVNDTQNPTISCVDVSFNVDPGLCSATVTLTAPAATDNCGVNAPTNDHPSTTFPVGTTIVNWTVVDFHSNINTCAQNVVIVDSENPVATCPSNITVGATAGLCNAVVNFTPTATDNCAGVSIVSSPASGSTFAVGTTTVNVTATDASANSNACSFTVTVNDTEAPVVTCPSNITVSATAGSCNAVVNFTPTATDNCAGVSIVSSPASGSTFAVGTTTVNVTATDASLNTNACSFTVTVNDTEAPVATCPSNITVSATAGSCNAVVSFTPTATDNCAGVSIISSPASGSTFAVGTTTVNVTATDASLNTNACSFTVTVNDTEAPVVTCPSNITVSATAGSCNAVVNFTPTATDNCAGVSIVSSPASGSTFALGTTTVNVTATDASLNTNACSFTVTVNDTEAPVATCPSNITVSATAGSCNAVVNFTPTATDNCAGVSIVSSPASGSTFAVGTTTVNVTATDASLNTNACSFTVTVNDTEAPVVTCPSNITVSATAGSCNAVVNFTPTATDNCAGVSIVSSPASGSTFALGTTTVNVTATDASLNTNACSFTVTVNDTEAPVVTCPSNITVSATAGSCNAVVNFTPTATDNCAGVSIVSSPASGSTFALGTTTVNVTATDASANSNACSFTVTVNDTEAPVVTCPSNITVSATAGSCNAVVNFTPTATDNCAGVSIVSSPASGSTFAVGTTTVNVTATDASLNTNACSFTVTVNDTEAPVATCPSNITVSATAGSCNAVVSFTPTATDNCAGVSIISSPASGSTFAVGTTTVNVTATDASLNTNACSFAVTVNDTEAPVVTCPSNITLGNTVGSCNAVVNFTPTATDNCAGVSIVSSPASGSTFALGTTTVNVTATDAASNTNACSFTVTVNDTEAPVATCPSNITVSATAGSCNAVVNFTPTATDNCAGVSIVSSPASGSTFAVGTTTVNVTATDAALNTNACSFTVTVNDTELPVVTCDSVVVTPTPGVPDVITAAELILSSTDNCGIASSSVVPNSFSCALDGQTVPVVVTVTDINGNPTICNTFVIVTGTGCSANNPPVAVCQPVTVNANGSCQGNAAASAFDGGSTDPDLDPLTFSVLPAGPYTIGTTNVTLTVSDGSLTSTCNTTITVVDNTAPVATCPSNITVGNSAGTCGAVVSFTPTATDNCTSPGSIAIVSSPASGSTFAVGTTTVNVTAIDAALNTNTCSFTVTVNDTEAPVVTCPSNITVSATAGSCNAVVNFTPTATDNCAGVSIVSSPASGSTFAVGTTTVNVTAIDAASNTNTCSFTVTVNDTEAPVVTCPSNITVSATAGSCNAVVNFTPTATDNCAGVSIVSSPASGSTFAVGTTTVNVTATDASLNTNACSFTVTVNDTEAPVATCPSNITVSATAGSCNAVVNFTPTATDNCAGVSIVSVPASGSTFAIGTTTVNVTATDASLNTNACSFTVTVNDTEAPVATCPSNITVSATAGSCNAVVNFTPTATDNCAGVSIVSSPASGSTFAVGTTTVNVTATDASLNTNACSFTVTVNDTEAPVVTCPSNITVGNTAGSCSAVVNFTPIATDNCAGVSIVSSPASGSTFAVGTTTVNVTATDASLNTNACSFTVTVNDTEAPVVTCPSNITASATAGSCNAVVNFTPTATDNCAGVSIVSSPASGSTFAVGTTTVNVTATDASLNTNACSFTVTVNDTEAPTITCIGNQTLNSSLGLCSAVVGAIGPLSFGDNCSGALVTYIVSGATTASGNNNASGISFNTGVSTVTYTITDASLNFATCSFTITVNDIEAPVVTCPSNITVGNTAGSCNAVVNFTPTATDNCAGVSIVSSPASGSTFALGTTTVNVTATDASLNTNACSFTVTVNDTEAPVVTCPSNITASATAGSCNAVVNFTPTATDNCAGVSIVSSPASGSTFAVGTTTVNVTATDASLNTNACSFTVTVNDTEAPVATCDSVVVTPAPGVPDVITAAEVILSSTDNCGIASSTVAPNSFSCAQDGLNVPVVVTVTDINGNPTTCNTFVTVVGVGCLPNNPPVAVCQPVTVNADGSCQATVAASAFDGGSTDPDLDPLSFSVLPAGPYALGTTNVTLTVSDGGLTSTCNTTITVIDNTAPDAGMVTSTFTLTGPLPINPSTNFYQIPLAGLPNPLQAGMLTSVCFDITYPTVEDLDLILLDSSASAGTIFSLSGLINGTDLTNTCFDRSSTGNFINLGLAPYTGNFDPTLFTPFDLDGAVGFPTNGHWLFDIENYGASTGTLNSLTLTFVYPFSQYPDIVNTCSETINSAPTLPDNCAGIVTGVASIAGVPQTIPFTINTQGTTPIVWSFDDGNGNITLINQNVILTDTIDPTLTCSLDIITSTDAGVCDAIVTLTSPTTNDNCGVASVSNNHPSTTFAIGSTPVIWTVTDINGNTNTCTQNVTVNDTEAPVANCPSNITVSNTAGSCDASVSYTPTATDNCVGASIVSSPASGSTFAVGTTTVNVTATDAALNTNACSFTVTVNDTEAPVATCPSNITVGNTAGSCDAVVNFTPTATDNCAGVSIVSSPASGSTFAVGTTTVNVTATDAALNTNACSFTVTVNDTELPAITCDSVVVTPTSGIPDVVLAAELILSSTDNCGIASSSVSPNSFDCSQDGQTIPVVVTVTDVNSNVSTCNTFVVVVGSGCPVNSPPIAVCQPVTVNADGSCQGNSLASAFDGGSTDPDLDPLTFSVIPAGPYALGTTNVTLTVSDGFSNSTCNTTITVVDVTAPVATCPANITVGNDAGVCGAVVNFTPTATDNCAGASIVSLPASGSTFAIGTTTVNVTATDASFNTNACSFTITVNDTEAPVVTCPSNITVSNDAGVCGAVVNFTPTATDNCAGVSIVSVPASGSTFAIGTTTVNVTATDASLNTNACSFTVTVNDTEAPVATCPSNITVSNDAGVCGAVVNFTPTATDNCAGVSIVSVPASGSTFAIGTTTVNVTATDASLNTNTCSFTITVNDTEAPVATCPANITVGNDAGVCGAVVNFTPTATDNCAGVSIVSVPASGSTFAIGTTTVNVTATDASLNTNACSFTVTVNDTEAPVATCPSNITVSNDAGVCGAVVNFTPTATDNCAGVSIVSVPASGSTFAIGTTTVNVTATDASFNTNACSFTVTVNDTEAPVATCPSNITVGNDAGVCGAVVNFTPTATDNCAGVSIVSVPASGSTFAIGTTTVNVTATDASLNTNTCSFTITVNDTEAPVATCPANITVGNDAGVCGAVVNFTPTATDNCAGVSIVSVPASGSTFAIGTTTVNVTATDASLNTNACSFTVTVNDTEAPVATCPSNITVGNDAGVCGAVVNFTPTATDNCAGVSIVSVPASGSTFAIGTTTVNVTATDASLNTNACSFTITVNDTENPTIVCSADVTTSTDPGICTATVVLIAPATSDNCGIASVSNDHPSTTYPSGTTVVTWTVVDVNGNSNTCLQNVTVNDGQNPVAACQNITAYLDGSGNLVINPADIDNGSTDNCGIVLMTLTPPSFNCSNVGLNTITFTVFDAAGNFDLCTATVDVQDTSAPIVIAPANVTVNADLGSCFATGVNIGNPTVSDNCGIQFIINDGLTFYPVGLTNVTWTIEDFNGNTTIVTQTVTVVDNQNPVIACQNLVVNLDLAGNATITPSMVDNGSTDNCGIASTTIDISSFNCSNVGPNTVTLTVTDIHGNVSTCTSIVTIVDNISPTIIAPPNLAINADLGSCTASAVLLGVPVISDNCAIVSLTNNAPSLFPVGNTTVTWTVVDASGNTSTTTQLVIVTDNQNPIISSMPANIVINNMFGVCFSTATWAQPIATDNCGISTLTSDYPSGTIFPVGTTLVSYTATDIHGNVSVSTFTVTVIDAQSPTIFNTPANIVTNAATGVCNSVVNWLAPFAMDNCSGVTLTSNFAPGATFPVGTTTVIYTATDGSANVTTSSFTITVVDNQNPIVSVVSPLNLNAAPGICSTPNTSLPLPTVSDNCGIASVVNNSSSPLPVGTSTVVWTVTDINGNVTTINQIVNVIDNQNPTITPPANIVVAANANNCSATGVSLGIPTFADNCGIASVSNNALVAYPVGITNVTWTVIDIHGNITTATQTVTVTPVPFVVGVTAVPAGPVCAGSLVTLSGTGAISYTWSGGIANGIPFTANTTTTYTVTGTGTFGCTNTATYTVVVNPLPTVSYVVTPNDSVCPNSSVMLYGTGASTYIWTGGIVDSVAFTIPSTTTYTVTGTDGFGCQNTATATIWTSPGSLSYTAFPNDTVCEGTQITLNGLGGSGYTWTSGIVNGVPFTPLFSYTTILSGVDAYGCSENIAVDIVVNYNPVVDLGPDIITSAGFVSLDAGNAGSSYVWNSNGMITSESIFVNNNGTYYVEVTDANGCVGTDTVNVAFSFAGINELSDIGVSLYPNPSNGIFTLSLSEMPRGNTLIRLVDELGQVLYVNELQSQTQSFDFSYLRAATYYLQIISKDYSVTKTFIITHKY